MALAELSAVFASGSVYIGRRNSRRQLCTQLSPCYLHTLLRGYKVQTF